MKERFNEADKLDGFNGLNNGDRERVKKAWDDGRVAPEDVLWSNLNMNPYEARIRTAIGWAITVGLIIVWAIPGTSYAR